MPRSESVTTSDGVRLALTRFPAEGPRRATLLAAHAMMARSSYMARMLGFLAGRGIECVSFDFRGHGQSVPPSPQKGGWGFGEYVVEDLPAVLHAVEPTAYLGHSLGGLVGLAAFTAGTPPPGRLVLVAASPWTRASLRRRAIATGLAALARPLGRLPVRALHLGSDDEPASYLAEFAGWVKSRSWPPLARLHTFKAPTLVVVNRGDLYCTHADARVVSSRLGGPVRTLDAEGDHFGLFTTPNLTAWGAIADFILSSQP
jgi:predicted alpha/beta hydrolase